MSATQTPSTRRLFARMANWLGGQKADSKASSRQLPFGYYYQTFMHTPGKPVWMSRDYSRFADEAYSKNVIAYRSIQMIASGAASIAWKLFLHHDEGKDVVARHPLLDLLTNPNPTQGGAEFFEAVFSYRLISGNAYMQAVGPVNRAPRELYNLRPDRVSVIAGKGSVPGGYRYTVRDATGVERYTDFPVNRVNGRSNVLHIKGFHPLDDWYGLSPVEAAAFSIDQHNQASEWNQSLLQNGARPSGALVVKPSDQGGPGTLSEDQYHRLKMQIDEQFSGASNAGRPVLLEGGLDWKEMALNPKDMDFLNAKHSSARDIALAFGVPPQLLGIPGDNTYANLAEARLALWEQTILPLADHLCDELNHWLVPYFGEDLELSYDTGSISALTLRREKMWEQVNKASFLTEDEKRAFVGLPPKEG